MFRTSKFTARGLTLVEMLITIMLISIMLAAIWAVYGAGIKVYYGQVSRYDIKHHQESE